MSACIILVRHARDIGGGLAFGPLAFGDAYDMAQDFDRTHNQDDEYNVSVSVLLPVDQLYPTHAPVEEVD